ncbi:MAG TPA: RuBisCO large subunit C-terminal-like domain-containing protein [Nitrospira sp.]|nr:RuBisCO large subunit C-terminal-like domain-containing protein [Nitrospira sp.]
MSWRGPRYGIAGLRRAVGIADRPLVCAVLKPLGHSPAQLARLAVQCVRGGADLIKDDQALLDQPFCPFAERVARCAEAIGEASLHRGRPCLYFAHVSGGLDIMRHRATEAKRGGATGLLVAPGLTGFDALRALTDDERLSLPIASHPTFLGTCGSRRGVGLAPAVAYALLPRLAGADMAIYPSFGAGYSMSRNACVAVAVNCRQAWHHVGPCMPAVGGRISVDRIGNVIGALGQDIVFVLGSRIQENEGGVVAALERFQLALAESL